jgi:hypothetical protein
VFSSTYYPFQQVEYLIKATNENTDTIICDFIRTHPDYGYPKFYHRESGNQYNCIDYINGSKIYQIYSKSNKNLYIFSIHDDTLILHNGIKLQIGKFAKTYIYQYQFEHEVLKSAGLKYYKNWCGVLFSHIPQYLFHNLHIVFILLLLFFFIKHEWKTLNSSDI